jgi:NTP pyrophosphatase (non-canonical NTP hydrolase)
MESEVGAMSVEPFQQRVATFSRHHRLDAPPFARLLDLGSEVGELSKEMLRVTEYGRRPFVPTEGWQQELGDVFYALLSLANVTDVDMERALDDAMKRYRSRIAAKGGPESTNP